METKPQRRTPVVLLQSRTTEVKSAGSKSIIMIIEKNAQMRRKRKPCRYVRNARKGLRRLSGQTQKGYSEELPDNNADFTDRGAPLSQYHPTLTRVRSRFEGVRTLRNDWNRRLRTP